MGAHIIENRRKACKRILEELGKAKIKSTNSTGWQLINLVDRKFNEILRKDPKDKVEFWPSDIYKKKKKVNEQLGGVRGRRSSFVEAMDPQYKGPGDRASREKARESLCRRKAGNCHEKAFFCLSLLETYYHVDSGRVPNAYAAMYCTNPTYDHVFVCIADSPTALRDHIELRDLGDKGVILDGWVEDFYFPNSLHFSKLHNPSQLKVKHSIKSAKILHYEYPRDPIPLFIDNNIQVTRF